MMERRSDLWDDNQRRLPDSVRLVYLEFIGMECSCSQNNNFLNLHPQFCCQRTERVTSLFFMVSIMFEMFMVLFNSFRENASWDNFFHFYLENESENKIEIVKIFLECSSVSFLKMVFCVDLEYLNNFLLFALGDGRVGKKTDFIYEDQKWIITGWVLNLQS